MIAIKIKPADIWSEVQKIAAENPDYVYRKEADLFPACSYERNGEPSCIVGQALFRLGVDVERLKEFDSSAESGINEIISYQDDDLFDRSDLSHLTELIITQSKQDVGVPWGEAVLEAVDHAPRMRSSYE